MNYKKRKFIFIAFTLIFFLSVPLIVLYTQGYRLDVQTFRLKKTAGIDLEITTPNTKVYLNEELEKETRTLFKNALFRNILPGEYEIKIEKEGYKPWSKKALLEAGAVARFFDIRLFPLELKHQLIAEEIQDMYISKNKKHAVALKRTPRELILIDLERQTSSSLFPIASNESVRNVLWSSDSSAFLVLSDTADGLSYLRTVSTESSPRIVSWDEFLRTSYPAAYNRNNVVIPSASLNTLYVLRQQPNGAFAFNMLDLSERIIRPDLIINIVGHAVSGEEIFFMDTLGSIQKMNIVSGITDELTPTSISRPNTSGAEIIVRDDARASLIINSGALFLWQENKPLERIGQNVSGALFSPNREKVLFWNNENATVYWLKETFGPPKRVIGDTETVQFGNILSARWATNSSGHIAVEQQGKIIFVELDGRDNRNIAEYNIDSQESLELDLSGHLIYTLLRNGQLVSLLYQ